MPLTKKHIAIIIASAVAACLVIAGIVVTIVLVTKKHKDSSETTISVATSTSTTTTPTTTTTTVIPVIYYNETLIIAFNVGYQNNDTSSFEDLQNSLNELIDALSFNGSLVIQLLPYTDKPIIINQNFNNPHEIKMKIDEILSKPENITGKNPSQINAITALQAPIIVSNKHSKFIPEAIETKYCFYSPSKEAYADSEAIVEDTKEAGIRISNIIISSNFALILMQNMSIEDYNITANQNFIDTTYDNVTVAVEFLDPDQFIIPTTTAPETTEVISEGSTHSTAKSNVTNIVTFNITTTLSDGAHTTTVRNDEITTTPFSTTTEVKS